MTPPLAAKACVYATPTCGLEMVKVVICTGGTLLLIVKEKVFEAMKTKMTLPVFTIDWTLIVGVDVPCAVGVPLNRPEDERVMPAGNVPLLTV